MKRPALVMTVNVLQTLLGLLLAGLAAYLIALTRSREILAESDAADTVHGLLIGALVIGIPAVITLIGVVGLWSGRFWGWVLSLATDIGLLGLFIYSILDDRYFDAVMTVITGGVVLAAVLLLLPAVRRSYWNKTNAQAVTVAN